MDGMSWRAQLAKSNINILNITWGDGHTGAEVYYEFMYHPKYGQTKWCKTWTHVSGKYDEDTDTSLPVCDLDILDTLKGDVLSLRKELED